MPEPAWIIKWRAREALANGQPVEAHRLLDALLASGNRRAFALRDEVVRGYLERAERALRHENIDGGWNDLIRVERLAPGDGGVLRLRETLTRLGLAEARATLEAGNALQALKKLSRLKERPAKSPEIAPLEETAQEWLLAADMADRGDFSPARSTLDRIHRRWSLHTSALDRFEQEIDRREERFRSAWDELHQAVAIKNWCDVLRRADDVLAVAPQHKEARQARNRAWQFVQPEREIAPAEEIAEVDSLPKRFYLWIDGVGAWLVCMSPRISIGQDSPEGGPIDVPLSADVSRIHACLTRDEESYLLETNRDVLVNGRPASKIVLRSGDQLALGSCRLEFWQPVPGCLSAKLLVNGGRRLPRAVDGVLLMADMLVLGRGEKVHVSMPELDKPLYLFRQKDRLGVRWAGDFVVEGEKFKDRALLPGQGCVSSESFAFAIEPLAASR